jgi:hypothetical protein
MVTPASSEIEERSQSKPTKNLPLNHGSTNSAQPPPDDETVVVDFELHVGRALDTLRRDYPALLTTPPDFTIYDAHIEVTDPTGVKVHGLAAYKNTFRLLHAVVKFLYCPSRSTMTFRMCFDKARQNIRIHWNAAVVPREIFGGSKTTLYVDGISVYELDRQSGRITEHRIEQLLMNNMPLRPKEGVFVALSNHHTMTVPSFCGGDPTINTHGSSSNGSSNLIVPFTFFQGGPNESTSSLFSMEAASAREDHADLDWEALEKKNQVRKKFGLEPLTPEEFRQLQAQVQELSVQQQQRAAQVRAEQQQQQQAKLAKQRASNNFLSKLLGAGEKLATNTCESNFDCQRPEVCCDFGFIKKCCSGGSLVGLRQQLQPIPVRVPVEVNPPPPGRF